MADTPQPIVDKKEVLRQAKEQLKALDALMPHINQANAAFGAFDDQAKQAQDLRTKLQQVIAAYSQ